MGLVYDSPSSLIRNDDTTSAGLAGLAGPLHGLANQEVLRFILDLQASLGGASVRPTDDQIKEYIWQVLNSGRVIPGYGHGVLRKTDPRFVALQEFIVSRADEFEGSEVVRLVRALERVAPGVLTEHGKTKNPNPNVVSPRTPREKERSASGTG